MCTIQHSQLYGYFPYKLSPDDHATRERMRNALSTKQSDTDETETGVSTNDIHANKHGNSDIESKMGRCTTGTHNSVMYRLIPQKQEDGRYYRFCEVFNLTQADSDSMTGQDGQDQSACWSKVVLYSSAEADELSGDKTPLQAETWHTVLAHTAPDKFCLGRTLTLNSSVSSAPPTQHFLLDGNSPGFVSDSTLSRPPGLRQKDVPPHLTLSNPSDTCSRIILYPLLVDGRPSDFCYSLLPLDSTQASLSTQPPAPCQFIPWIPVTDADSKMDLDRPFGGHLSNQADGVPGKWQQLDTSNHPGL